LRRRRPEEYGSEPREWRAIASRLSSGQIAGRDSAPSNIGFNARYLLDIVGQLSSDTALIRLADPGSPTFIQDREGARALYVLMPLRV
jgi:DNA polymerase III sliding clamp (beta) subunit (PCNA family)